MLGIRACLSTAVLSLAMVAPAAVSHASPEPRRTVADEVTHRIVWDHWIPGRRGIHLRSAAPDGTDRRPLYDTDRGFTLDLSVSHDGGQVAFSPCCQHRFPYITVVDVNDGTVLDPLSGHRHAVFAVGGIGFSPDDSHLAFEGNTMVGDQVDSALWTVALDGTDLQRVLTLPWEQDGGQGFNNPALVWTDEGILYSDGQDLRLATPPADPADEGTSTVVLPRVDTVRGSGDGSRIVTTRAGETGYAIWISAPDGSDAHRLLRRRGGVHRAGYGTVTPDYDGRQLLAFREVLSRNQTEVVTWQVGQRPADATVLPIPGSFTALTWN